MKCEQVLIKLIVIFLFFSFGNCCGEEFNMHFSERDGITIRDIITSMGEKSVPKLLFDSVRLNNLGDSIRHIPPLKFLAFIVTDNYLKECLKKTSKSYFKWSSFIEGVGERMGQEYAAGRLMKDLLKFSLVVERDYQQLERYAHKHQWEKFVKSLL